MFEKTIGDPAASSDFIAQGRGYALHLSAGQMSLRVAAKDGRSDQVGISFVGSNRNAVGIAVDKVPTVTNYFIGRDRSQWRTGVENYAKVRYAGIYPGTDVVFYGHDGQIEHDFTLAPAADPRSIVLQVTGAKSLALNSQNEIVISTREGEVLLKKPAIYQESLGKRVSVEGSYRLLAGNRIGFSVEHYDKTRELTIDPVIVFATYIGGFTTSQGVAVAADPSTGDVYVAGTVTADFTTGTSPAITPQTHAPNGTTLPTSNGSLFVAKLASAANGSTFSWVTYVGGTGPDTTKAIAFGGSQVVVAGFTQSNDFPVSSNAPDATFGSGTTAGFVTALDSSSGGTGEYYATYVAPTTGSGDSSLSAVALDGTGNIYVAGALQNSTDFVGADCSTVTNTTGGGNSFVAELDPTGSAASSLLHLTIFNGDSSGSTFPRGLAVSGSDVYVVGEASTDFPTGDAKPTKAPAITTITGASAAYFADVQFSANQATCSATTTNPSLVHARVYHDNSFGGTGSTDIFNAISLQSATSLYIAGQSNSGTLSSLDATSTSSIALSTVTNAGGEDALVLHIDPSKLSSGSAAEVLTLMEIGGSNDDNATSISIDSTGKLFLGGSTLSLQGANTAFPTTTTAGLPLLDAALRLRAAQAGFVAELNNSTLALSLSTLIGSDATTNADVVNGVAAATNTASSLKGDLVAVTGTFHQTTTTNTSASAFQANAPVGDLSFYVGLLEFSGTASGATLAQGTFPAQVNWGFPQQYQFAITSPNSDSVLQVSNAGGGLTPLQVDSGSDGSFNIAQNCTAGAGGITCKVPQGASGNIIIDGTVTITSGTLSVTATLNDSASNSISVTETSTANPAPLDITATDTKTYGELRSYGVGSTQFTVGANQLRNGDSIASVTIADTNNGGAITAAAGGTYPLTPSAAVAGGTTNLNNYAITYHTGSLTVNPAPLDITANNDDKIFGEVRTYGANSTAFTTGNNQLRNGDTIASVTISDTNNGGVSSAPANGNYPLEPSLAMPTTIAANYNITYLPGTLTVSPATPTVTVTDSQPTFNAAPQNATAVATGVGGAQVNGTFRFTYDNGPAPTNVKTTNGGAYVVAATFTSSDPDYTNAPGSGTLTIKPATPTVVITDPQPIYNAAPQTATIVAKGVNGAAVTGTFATTYDGGPVPTSVKIVNSAPAAYLVVSQFTSGDTNYTNATNSNGALTIRQATPTVTVSADPLLTYDATPHSATATVSGVNGATVTGTFSFTYDGNATAPTNAKTSYAVVATFTSSDTNYNDETGKGTLTIKQATPTVAVGADPQVTFDGNPHAATATAKGVGGATVSGNFSFTYDGSSTAPTNAKTSYAVRATFTSSDANYAGGNDSGTLTIRQATPVVVVTDPQLTFDGQPHTAIATIKGVGGGTVNGNFTFTYDGSTTAPTNAKTSYAVVADFTSSDGNYTAATGTGSLTINQAKPTLTLAADPQVTYDGNSHATSATVAGVGGVAVNGTLSLTYDGSTTPPANAKSSYAVLATFTSSDSNYTGASSSGMLTIKLEPLSVTANNQSRTYGAANPTLDGSLTGAIATDNITASFSTGANPASAVGAYPVTATLNDPGNRLGNYNVASTPGTLTVTAAPLTITAKSVSKTFGQTVTFTGTEFTASGLVNNGNGDAVSSVTLASGGSASLAAVGAYSIAPTSPSGSGLGNYAITLVQGALTVGPATTNSVVVSPQSTKNSATFTFIATVAPQFAGVPGGTVTFMDNGSALASNIPLVNGTASFSTTVNELAAGQTHTITAVYNKDDPNFAAATTQVGASITVGAALTTTPGAPIQPQTLQIANPGGSSVTYSGLSCGVLDAFGNTVKNTICTGTPAGSFTLPATVTLTIATSNGNSTTALSAAPENVQRVHALESLWLAMPAMVLLPLAIPAETRRRLRQKKALFVIGLLLVLCVVLVSVGCGGGGFTNANNQQPGTVGTAATPNGSYVVQITATNQQGQSVAVASIPLTVAAN